MWDVIVCNVYRGVSGVQEREGGDAQAVLAGGGIARGRLASPRVASQLYCDDEHRRLAAGGVGARLDSCTCIAVASARVVWAW